MKIALDQAMELMAIPGATANEGTIAARVKDILQEMGVPAECMWHDDANTHSPYGGEVGNLIVRLEGHGRGTPRMLACHLDTVGGAVGSLPRLDGDRVVNDAPERSLGADCRSGVAALLCAARALMERKGDHAPCVLLFMVQEEVGLVGSKYLDVTKLGSPPPAMGFNFDGGEANEIVHDIVGTERLVIDVTGVGVHTARPETGISCAEILADALGVLVNGGWHGVVERDGGWATANLGVLKGGTNSNVTMPALHALAECRSFDIDFRTKVLQAWRDAFEQAVEHANQGAKERGVEGRATVTFAKGPEYPPCTMPESSPVVQAASAAIRRLGREPNLLRDAGGQDTCNIVAKGVPTVGVGCGMQHCHEYIEYLDVPEFLDGCRLAIDLATADLIS